MQKYHKKHDNVYYITKNYVLKPIYNDENECINDMLSLIVVEISVMKNSQSGVKRKASEGSSLLHIHPNKIE